jgi:hypothetical protein
MTLTDDRPLTPDALRDIEARAEANYRILAPDVQSVPDTTWYVAQDNYPTNPLILAAPDAGWARGMVDELTRRDNDARLLLAHIRAQDAELARLREEIDPTCLRNGCIRTGAREYRDAEEHYRDDDEEDTP